MQAIRSSIEDIILSSSMAMMTYLYTFQPLLNFPKRSIDSPDESHCQDDDNDQQNPIDDLHNFPLFPSNNLTRADSLLLSYLSL